MFKRRGFTIIELLLYLAIMGVSLAVLSSFYFSTSAVKAKNNALIEVEQQGLRAVETIRQAIIASGGISFPTTGSSGAILSLSAAAGGETAIFDIGAGKLRVSIGADSEAALHNSRVQASNLIFYNLSQAGFPGTIAGSFTLETINPSGRQEFSYAQTFNFVVSRRW